MAQYNEVYEIEAAILTGLMGVMDPDQGGQVAEDVKTAIAQAVTKEVYMAYPSKLPPEVERDGVMVKTRRWHEGGLADPSTYDAKYHPNTQELNVEIKTEWQNIGFKRTTGAGTGGNDLADVIEENGMYGAGARPFIQQAENNIKNIKTILEETIADHLNRTI